MSSGETSMEYTPEEVERLKQSNYLLGVVVGWEQVAEQLFASAGTAFSHGDDSRAELLRLSARAAMTTAQRRREELDKYDEEEESPL